MKDAIAGQFIKAVKSYEEQLQNAAKGNPKAENALRWSMANVPYEVIAPFMIRENLVLLAGQKMARRTLFSLSGHRLRYEDRFLFWEDILSAVDVLPNEWRATICLDCLHSSESWNPRERNGCLPYYNPNDYNKEELSSYVVSSKWLVDAPLVRKWYCRLHKPGCEVLNCIDGRRPVNYPLRQGLMECIRQDDLPGFALLQAMSQNHTAWTLVKDVLDNNALAIFSWLVENDDTLFTNTTPYQLMVYAASNLKSSTAIHAISSIERRFPGTARKPDDFGNTLLWYCLHNKNILWFNENSRLVSFLKDCGCRQDTPNHLGLTFSDICRAVTPVQKRSATRIAYNLVQPDEWYDVTSSP